MKAIVSVQHNFDLRKCVAIYMYFKGLLKVFFQMFISIKIFF